MARPTDYTDAIPERAEYYLQNYNKEGDAIPSIVGLTRFLGVARSTIYDWASQPDKRELSDMLEKIKEEQERVLVNKGLEGKFNSNIVKLALTKHGYTDKSDITSGGQSLAALFNEAKQG